VDSPADINDLKIDEDEVVEYAPAGDERGAILAHLADIHQEVRADRHLDLDIPGYHGVIFARFRPYELAKTESKLKGVQRRVRKNEPVLLRDACDTIIDACEQLFVRNLKTGKEMPIDDVVPVTFEERLAKLLKFYGPEITQARHVVIAMFPTQQSILMMSNEITQWLAGAQEDADEEFLGESQGMRP